MVSRRVRANRSCSGTMWTINYNAHQQKPVTSSMQSQLRLHHPSVKAFGWEKYLTFSEDVRFLSSQLPEVHAATSTDKNCSQRLRETADLSPVLTI